MIASSRQIIPKACPGHGLLFRLLPVFLTASCAAQTVVDSAWTGRTISAFRIAGNERTKDFVIIRELKEQVGDPLDLNRMEEDRKRIQNLHLFNRVDMRAEPDSGRVRLRISVTERWTLFPYPIFEIQEKDWKRISWGAGLVHANFRGRAEQLHVQTVLGYNPKVSLGYSNPWLDAQRRLFTSLNVFSEHIQNKHYQDKTVEERRFGSSWAIGKRIGYNTFMEAAFGYRHISLNPAVSGGTLSPSGKDRSLFFSGSAIFDYRDLQEYPHDGWYLGLGLRKFGFSGQAVNYTYGSIESRRYFPLTRSWTAAFRASAVFSSGKTPAYDRVHIGYSERIRGHFFETWEGENRILAGAAIRFPFFRTPYFSLAKKAYLSNLQFGVGAGLFVDSGAVWFQSQKPKVSLLQSGWGFGLHFFFPYAYILRIETAFDEAGRQEWIADVGVDI